jgi:histidinol-phosphate aminotransferase
MGTVSAIAAAPPMREALRLMSAYTLEARQASDKLDQNEAPFDLPAEFKEEVLRRAVQRPWNLYPDFELTRLRTALADCHGLRIENVLVGNGSNELLFATLAAVVEPGTPVILPTPTFTLYGKLVDIFGGEVRRVVIDPSTGTLPAKAIIGAIERSPSPPLVVICSPNNPTGGVLAPGGLEMILATGALVLLDRAYGDFAGDRLPPLQPNLVTLSSFSKSWGLAGLRIGWMSGEERLLSEIRKVKLPYNLNFISEEAAILALQRQEMRRSNVEHVVAERERLYGELARLDGIHPFPSGANFISFRVAGGSALLFARLLENEILVRDVSTHPGLSDVLRVTIGTSEQNRRFFEVVSTFVGGEQS